MAEFDSIFYISIATIGAGVIGLCIRYCYKIECSDIDLLFGCVKIHRAVELEDHNNNSNDTPNLHNLQV
jgi:hypothetical protein